VLAEPVRGWSIQRVADTDADDLAAVRELFSEYGEWLGGLVCSRTLPGEIANLPGVYSGPTGALLLARDDEGGALGVIGVRAHDEHACEMKRLYVRPQARGTGLGRALSEAAIAEAREMGYEEIRLTTLPDAMPVALEMYRAMGFEDSEPFVDHSNVDPAVHMSYMRLRLR